MVGEGQEAAAGAPSGPDKGGERRPQCIEYYQLKGGCPGQRADDRQSEGLRAALSFTCMPYLMTYRLLLNEAPSI